MKPEKSCRRLAIVYNLSRCIGSRSTAFSFYLYPLSSLALGERSLANIFTFLPSEEPAFGPQTP